MILAVLHNEKVCCSRMLKEKCQSEKSNIYAFVKFIYVTISGTTIARGCEPKGVEPALDSFKSVVYRFLDLSRDKSKLCLWNTNDIEILWDNTTNMFAKIKHHHPLNPFQLPPLQRLNIENKICQEFS